MITPFGECNFAAGERLYTLPDCGHTMYVATIDSWMHERDPRARAATAQAPAAGGAGGGEASPTAAPAAVQLPRCPQCNTVVRTSRRYADIVRACLQQIEAVKQQQAKNALPSRVREAVHRHQYDRAEDIARAGAAADGASPLARARAQYMLAWAMSQHQPPRAAAEVLAVSARAADTAAKLQAASAQDAGPAVSLRADCLLLWAIGLLRSSQAAQGREKLVEYIAASRAAGARHGHSVASTRAGAASAARGGIAAGGGPDALLARLQADPDAAAEIPLDQLDQLTAVLTMNADFGMAGNWFMCPNGHPYVIGECGGATQQSRCPECRETIGGGGHQLVASNRHAGNFDGSTMGAYNVAMIHNPPPDPRHFQ
jgi:hypothetical protein